MLKDDERCVCEIFKELGKKQSLISHHLQVARRCGLVKSVRQGKWIKYRLANPTIAELLAKVGEDRYLNLLLDLKIPKIGLFKPFDYSKEDLEGAVNEKNNKNYVGRKMNEISKESKKAAVYILLVVLVAMIVGYVYGMIE